MNLDRRNFVKLAGMSIPAVALFSTTGCTASDWEQTAIDDLPIVVTILESVLTVAGGLAPGTTAIINTAVAAATVAIQSLSQIIADFKANPSATLLQKIQIAAQDVSKALSNILQQIAPVTGLSSQILNVINSAVALGLQIISSIASIVQSTQVTSSIKGRVVTTGKLPSLLSPAKLKASYNASLVANGFSAAQIK